MGQAPRLAWAFVWRRCKAKLRETIRLNSDKTSPVPIPELTTLEGPAKTHAAPAMVQTLGLFSSTALVAGSMIGSGIFLVDADIARDRQLTSSCTRRMGCHWHSHGDRRPQLRRTCRHDAQGWRPVCLPARVTRAALGISLRLDTLPRYPDRHHRRRLRGLWQIPGRVLSIDLDHPLALAHRPRSACHPSGPWCSATWKSASTPPTSPAS